MTHRVQVRLPSQPLPLFKARATGAIHGALEIASVTYDGGLARVFKEDDRSCVLSFERNPPYCPFRVHPKLLAGSPEPKPGDFLVVWEDEQRIAIFTRKEFLENFCEVSA